MQTWAFITCFALAAITLLGFYSLKSSVVLTTVYRPTQAQYLDFVANGENPSCPCSVVPTVGSAVYLRVPSDADFSQNFCSSIYVLDSFHRANDTACSAASAAGAPGGEAACLLWRNQYLPLLFMLCDTYKESIRVANSSLEQAQFPPQLLQPDVFASFAVHEATTQMLMSYAMSGQVMTPVTVAALTPPLQRPDLSWGAEVRYPSGCSCNASYSSTQPPAGDRAVCAFRTPFDSRPSPQYDYGWTCNAEANVLNFPLALLTDPSFYLMQGVDAAAVQTLTRFAGWGNVTNDSAVSEALLSSISMIFPYNASTDEFDTSHIQAGVLQTDFSRYFAACAPASCLLAYDARPSFLAAVTTALGVLSGLNTILRLVIDNGYDWLCRARCDRRLNERKRARAAAAKTGAALAPLLLADDWDRDSDDSDAEVGHAGQSGAPAASAGDWRESHVGASDGGIADWGAASRSAVSTVPAASPAGSGGSAAVQPLLAPQSVRGNTSVHGSLSSETRTGPMRLPSLSPSAVSATHITAASAVQHGMGQAVSQSSVSTRTAVSPAAFFGSASAHKP